MKVVFLDFDGVLNSAEYRSNADDYHSNFIDERKIGMLADFANETDAKIVLTTQWRLHWNEGCVQAHPDGERINALFEKHGLKIYSKTDYLDNNRNLEIADWLVRHDVESYVIFDDVDFGWSESNRIRFVRTDDSADGLSEENLATAKRIFEKEKGVT